MPTLLDYARERTAALDTNNEPPAPPPGVQIIERREPKLTRKLIDDITTAIVASVAYPSVAAQAHGVSDHFFKKWMALGRAGIGEMHVEFYDAIMRAEAQSEMAEGAAITLGKAGSATRLDRLGRRHPARWAQLQKQEVSGPNGGPVRIAPGVAELPAEAPEDVAALPEESPE